MTAVEELHLAPIRSAWSAAPNEAGLVCVRLAKPWVLESPWWYTLLGSEGVQPESARVLSIVIGRAPGRLETTVVTSLLLDNVFTVVGRDWCNIGFPVTLGFVREGREYNSGALLIRGSTHPDSRPQRVDLLRVAVDEP